MRALLLALLVMTSPVLAKGAGHGFGAHGTKAFHLSSGHSGKSGFNFGGKSLTSGSSSRPHAVRSQH